MKMNVPRFRAKPLGIYSVKPAGTMKLLNSRSPVKQFVGAMFAFEAVDIAKTVLTKD